MNDDDDGLIGPMPSTWDEQVMVLVFIGALALGAGAVGCLAYFVKVIL